MLTTPKSLSISDVIKEGKLKDFLERAVKELPFEMSESCAADIAKLKDKSDFYEFYNHNFDGFVIRADGLEVFIQNYGFGGGNGGYGVLLKTEKIADILDRHILEVIKDAAKKRLLVFTKKNEKPSAIYCLHFATNNYCMSMKICCGMGGRRVRSVPSRPSTVKSATSKGKI